MVTSLFGKNTIYDFTNAFIFNQQYKMKYSLLDISLNPRLSDKLWSVKFDDSDEYDRKAEPSGKYVPHGTVGFFYYPRTWDIDKAFKILKAAMIKERKEDIAHLQKNLDALEKLELPKRRK